MVEMMSKACKYCESTEHTPFYCLKKPKTPIKARSKPSGGVVKQKTNNLTSNAKKLSTKPIKRSKVVKDLDNIFSQYIRLKDSDEYGYCICVTSGQKMFWKEAQCGHFVSRGKYPTRWDETNCHPQSVYSNIFLKGDYINYTIYMIDRYGREYVDELIDRSKQSVKIPTIELIEKISYYKTEVARIKSGKGLHN